MDPYENLRPKNLLGAESTNQTDETDPSTIFNKNKKH